MSGDKDHNTERPIDNETPARSEIHKFRSSGDFPTFLNHSENRLHPATNALHQVTHDSRGKIHSFIPTLKKDTKNPSPIETIETKKEDKRESEDNMWKNCEQQKKRVHE